MVYPGHGRRRRRRGPQGRRAPVYAAVNLGTNNCRLLVARPAAEGFRVIDSYSRIVRLGEGLASGERLSDAAVGRTVEALKVCAAKIRRRGATRVRSVATEACRRAVNSGAFLDRVRAETGLALEAISPGEEARLTVSGWVALLDAGLPSALVFDIGGGSTEVMWIEGDGAAPRLVDHTSLPWGVVSLAEALGPAPATASGYAAVVGRIDAGLATFDARHGIAGAVRRGRVQMLGTSCTVTTIGALHLGLAGYDRRRIDGLRLGFEDIRAVGARIGAMDDAARAAHPCIGSERADLVLAGCAVLEAICRRWPVGSLRVADRGIREGLLLGMMALDGTGPGARPGAAPR